MNQFKNLKVWQKAMGLAKETYAITHGFPQNEQFGLTTQIRRSAVSVASNIAEGAGRNSNGEYVQFLGIATGSAFELETQLILAIELGYIKEESNSLLELVQEVQKMLRSLQAHLKPTSKN